ncbi:MAG TPA: M3 family metallopeptidase [Nocardioidaceae bacterium]
MTTTADQPDYAHVTPLVLPTDDDGWHDWLVSRCDDQLARARSLVERLRETDRDADARQVLEIWNLVSMALSNAFAASSVMSNVLPNEALRTQAEAAMQEAQKLSTDLTLDAELYATFAALDGADLDDDAQRVLEHTMRDFRRAGVDRDEETRQRLRELAEREVAVGQEFARNIRDDVRRVTFDTAQLAGLPDDYVAAHPVGDDGMIEITTDYPDVYPFLTFAHDRDARREVLLAFNNRAWPANDDLLAELLSLRAEHAALLGYAGWPDYDAEVKMIGTGDAIAGFIDQITAAATASGERDRDRLLARLRIDHPDVERIDRADSMYYAEVLRREEYDVDAQLVRTYFDFSKVRQGLLDVTSRLFGLQWRPRPDVTTWTTDVVTYDVELDDELIGRIYLDLHPREGKFKHAAQFSITAGVNGHQLPEGVLVCNFPRGLMEHREVVTLFHEFGHLVHHVVGGRQDWSRFSGVATEWDFVEAPSQMLEEWAWDAEVLRTFATNAAGEPIPAELVTKMRAADDFGKGYAARTQMFYAAVSYHLHQQAVPDLTAKVAELQAAYDLFPFIEGTHFHASFGHLHGYTSAYYTYMWILVIAKDLFSAFDRDDLFEATTAARYRDLVLAQGGRRDAADLVEAFLGRPYTIDAFTRWLNQ